MNRRHSAADYLRVIDRLRKARSDLAFSSDFIVGFPSETEQDFRDTLRIVHAVGYATAFSFKYSARPGTPAADRADQVPEPEKVDRLARLQQELEQHRRSFNAQCRERILPVLFERHGRLPGQLVGRSPYLQPVQAMAPKSLIGQVVDVEITAIGSNSLFGSVTPARSATAAAYLATQTA
jgi:tRNA-2-methylthio-N6-dimethylallyladenosine synthase